MSRSSARAATITKHTAEVLQGILQAMRDHDEDAFLLLVHGALEADDFTPVEVEQAFEELSGIVNEGGPVWIREDLAEAEGSFDLDEDAS